MNDEFNVCSNYQDISIMDQDELLEYGLSRMKVMLKMEQNAIKWLKEKDTPFQQMVLETARHHVALCEKKYGISRYDRRLRSFNAL